MIPRGAKFVVIPKMERSGSFVQVHVESQSGRFPIRRQIRHEWSSLHFVWFSHLTTEGIHINWTPWVEDTFWEFPEFSPLELMAAELLRLGRVTESYVVDLFEQKDVFDQWEQDFRVKYAGMELVICGGKVYVGDTFESALEKARAEFPNRPYYSISLRINPTAV